MMTLKEAVTNAEKVSIDEGEAHIWKIPSGSFVVTARGIQSMSWLFITRYENGEEVNY